MIRKSTAGLFALILFGLFGGLAACSPPDLTAEQEAVVQSLSLAALPELLPDPSNRFSTDPQAAALGKTLFSDKGLSRDGDVACATCHVADRQFQDDIPLGKGAGTTDRRTMPIAGVAYSPWFFWDGRKDSLWSQAIGPLESQVEHAGTRTLYANYLADQYREEYEAVFGPLPDLSGAPASAGPFGTTAEQAAWAEMTPELQNEINRVFANLGKSIAAFERSILHPETRFDRFANALAAGTVPKGEAALSNQEIAGLTLFIGEGECVNCHNGPRFTNDQFFNTGVAQAPGVPFDRGRAAAVVQVEGNPFNCVGKYSDATPEQCGEFRFMVRGGDVLERAFKTPSLRGVIDRPPFMHSGRLASIEDVITHYSNAPEAPSGQSELEPKNFTADEIAALIAFLTTISE